MSLGDWVKWDKGTIDFVADVTWLEESAQGVDFTDWSSDNRVLQAPPKTQNYAHVGTAFDYAMRVYLSLLNGVPLSVQLMDEIEGKPVMEDGIIARYGAWGNAKRESFVDSFCEKVHQFNDAVPLVDFVRRLLPDCIVLSNLDSVYRSGQDFGDDSIFAVNLDDVQDLSGLVGLLDASMWRCGNELYKSPLGRSQDMVSCFLNPTFGESSRYVGGGDADIVLNGCLIDIKTTKYLKVKKEYLRQLMGYYVLNLREGDPYKVHSLGIYFSRFGVLYRRLILNSPASLAIWPERSDDQCFCSYPDGKQQPCSWNPDFWSSRYPDASSTPFPSVWSTIEESLTEYQAILDEDGDDDMPEEFASRDYLKDEDGSILGKGKYNKDGRKL